MTKRESEMDTTRQPSVSSVSGNLAIGRRTAGPMIALLMVAAACQNAPLASSPAPGASGADAASAATSGTPSSTGQAAFIDVPMYRMDPTHQGVQPGPGPDGQPQLVWSVKAGGGIEHSPVLGDGTLFVGSDDGNLYALDARSGTDRWRLDLGASLPSTPVFGNGVVAVSDKNGVLHGVAAATGAEVWHTAPVVNAASPVLAGGIVYINGTDHRAHGFDLQTGVERWSWTTTADLSNAFAIAADTAYIGSQDGVLHAVALAGSHELWSYQMLIGTDLGYPLVSGDVVVVTTKQGAGEPSGELYALDRTSGKLLWRFRGPSGLQISPGSVRDGILYAPTQADGIYAFRVVDGSQVWQAAGPGVFFPTALVGDTLYMTSDTPPEIAAVRASDGSPLWALPTSGVPKGNPLVSGGMLFGTDISGEIRAYGSATTVAAGPTATPRALTSPSAAPSVPNPFEIIARYDATKLGLDRPLALAIGPNGDAYVTETNDRVSQIAPDGTVVRRWGKEGSKAGEFDFVGHNPEDGAHGAIAVAPDGKVYVSDSHNHRVQVFTADGTFVRMFGSFGTGAGQFVLPSDLSVDATGNVYVLDDTLPGLSKFGPNGAFLWTVDGTTDQELEGPLHGADIDSKGRIVVGNDGTGRVVYLDPDGKVVDAFSALKACDITIDPADNLYIAGCASDRIDVYDASHALIGSSGPDMLFDDPPQFGPGGETLDWDRDRAIVKLKVILPPA
jgi:outer membrane protein assembly factor BamB